MSGSRRLRAKWTALLATLTCWGCVSFAPPPAEAGVPRPATLPGIDPTRCGVALSGQGAPCQFRFQPDGGADVLTVSITLRTAFDQPVAGCSTSVTLTSVGPDTFNVCACCGERQAGFSDAQGVLQFTWDRIGGFGTLEARVLTHCGGNLPVGELPFEYTSSDLTGNCSSNGPDVDVLDLALWARGLSPGLWIRSDWDCSGGPADILDLAAFAGGSGDNCDDGGPCP